MRPDHELATIDVPTLFVHGTKDTFVPIESSRRYVQRIRAEAVRRAKAGIPDEIGHREKWRLGLDTVDEMIGWGLRPPLLVADSGYGDAGELRQGLEDRDIPYVVQVPSTTTAYPPSTRPTAPPYSGAGRRPTSAYQDNAPTVKDLALAADRDSAHEVSWRQGSKRRAGQAAMMRSHFLFLRVRPAAAAHRQTHRGRDLPLRWLIVEWPPDQPEPLRYWLSDLPSTTPEEILVRLAKLRWRIEHDYRELKDALGLDHYEGRTWTGWHHHVTLVAAAHGFLTLQRLDPKVPAPA